MHGDLTRSPFQRERAFRVADHGGWHVKLVRKASGYEEKPTPHRERIRRLRKLSFPVHLTVSVTHRFF